MKQFKKQFLGMILVLFGIAVFTIHVILNNTNPWDLILLLLCIFYIVSMNDMKEDNITSKMDVLFSSELATFVMKSKNPVIYKGKIISIKAEEKHSLSLSLASEGKADLKLVIDFDAYLAWFEDKDILKTLDVNNENNGEYIDGIKKGINPAAILLNSNKIEALEKGFQASVQDYNDSLIFIGKDIELIFDKNKITKIDILK